MTDKQAFVAAIRQGKRCTELQEVFVYDEPDGMLIVSVQYEGGSKHTITLGAKEFRMLVRAYFAYLGK